MSNDRFGLKWGFAGGTTLASIAEAREAAGYAEAAGFDSFWISHAMGVDSLAALACLGADFPGLEEVGTSVVPLYGRHPVGLAQLTRTAQNAVGGRLTLGIGAASRRHAEQVLGLSWDKPFTFTRDFIDALQPLLNGEPADNTGELVSAHADLGVEAAPTPILLAALGPRMLRFAGARVAGTTLGQCGPQTIRTYIRPHLEEGAAKAGRASGDLRIMALVRVCVLEEKSGARYDAAKALARQISAQYLSSPSYANANAHEGLEDPSDIHLIGSWAEVLDGLAQYGEAGATDLRVQPVAPDAAATEATRAALAAYLSG